MRIATHAPLAVNLSRIRTLPEKQARVLTSAITASQAWRENSSFAAGAILRSLDGQRLVVYRQYSAASARLVELTEQVDSHWYQVVTLEAPPSVAPSPLLVSQNDGLTTLVNIFDTDPARQQQLVDLWIRAGEPFTHHPGFIGAALHKSTDGARVVNYARWRSPADWQDLVSHHGREFAAFRPLGQSDPHLYELVHLVEVL
jgi:hypothetical protein